MLPRLKNKTKGYGTSCLGEADFMAPLLLEWYQASMQSASLFIDIYVVYYKVQTRKALMILYCKRLKCNEIVKHETILKSVTIERVFDTARKSLYGR